MWIPGLGGLREMDLTRYGVCKSSDRTKTCSLLRSIQVKFTIAKRLYIVKKISQKDLRTIFASLLCNLKKGPDDASLTFTVIFI